HNLHNILTLRGALVRDPRVWAHYLDETIQLFGDQVDVLFAQHHWPRWGRERALGFLAKQRDVYAYLHDQTLRLLNKGYTGKEIAEQIALPPSLEQEWHCRGYYGSVSHNVKAIYQRYMGWFDGNPAHLWEHPPEEAAKRYVEYMGGSEAVLEKARAAFEAGDLRWVVEVVNHVVFAEPDNAAARELQAQALEQLGFGAENGPWRNFFLTGAKELREGVGGTATTVAPADMIASLTCEQLFDSMAIRVDGPRAFDVRMVLDWVFPDLGATYELSLENAVLTHRVGGSGSPDATITLERTLLDRILTGGADLQAELASGGVRVEGDAAKLGELLSLFDAPDPSFAIVTP
ncbi:MAG TPA: alkyl sulfatase dimerization domain-containing protein, partial [Thermoleophilaceae bacterium]